MNTPLTPPPEPLAITLARKMVLLALLMIVTAIGMVVVLLQVKIRQPLLVSGLTAAVMGLVGGSAARWVLRKQTPALRIASALAFVVGGLALLGWLTAWRAGIGPLTLRASPNWEDLVQFVLGSGIAFLPLYAWRRRSLAIEPAAQPPQPKKKKRPQPRKQSEKRPQRKIPPAPARASSLSTRAVPAAVTAQAKPVRKSRSRRKPQLQLSSETEHRCPYCLELIQPNDPRGIVECKICHTLHHADCWAITGTCQVPHYTS